jgi:nucleoside-diphosphate-sugar epimerase
MGERHILITGAAGFVGCRLSERLAFSKEYSVTAMVRRWYGRGMPRLARLPIKWELADIMNLNDLINATKDVDVIVHLAYGDSKVNTIGTENVLKAAYRNKVRKVIHMSTAAVHGLDPDGPEVFESAPYEKKGDAYRSSKAKAEKIIYDFQSKYGLPVVILRPPLIYGPFSRAWSVKPIQEINSCGILVNGGSGYANLVYIDNLIDAIILAIENDAANGQTFFVVDDEKPVWKEVYERYAAIANKDLQMRSMSIDEIERIRKTIEPSKVEQWILVPIKIGSDVLKKISRDSTYRIRLMQVPWIRFLAKAMLPAKIKARIKGTNKEESSREAVNYSNNSFPLPSKDMVTLLSTKSTFSNEKIKQTIGFSQKVSLDEGMELTKQWLHYYRLI